VYPGPRRIDAVFSGQPACVLIVRAHHEIDVAHGVHRLANDDDEPAPAATAQGMSRNPLSKRSSQRRRSAPAPASIEDHHKSGMMSAIAMIDDLLWVG
jgi:hypothetical protein